MSRVVQRQQWLLVGTRRVDYGASTVDPFAALGARHRDLGVARPRNHQDSKIFIVY